MPLRQQRMEHKAIGQLAAEILHECSWMERECGAKNIASPMLEAGTSTAFWSDTLTDITAARTNALGLLDRLSALLRGPHEFLHEFVASNWDHAALYAFLQSQSLEHIASSGGVASLSNLSKISGIPGDKLVRILALLRCKNIVQEPEHDVFALTAISEELIKDGDFRAWVEFQYIHGPAAMPIGEQHAADDILDYSKRALPVPTLVRH